jgi:hypothetical protein
VLYYCLTDHTAENQSALIQTNMDSKTLQDHIFYIQAKVHLELSDNIFLDGEDMAFLLEKHFGCARQRVVDLGRGMEEIDLVKLWNNNLERMDSIVADPKFSCTSVEHDLLKMLDKHADNFMFIDVSAKLPKWAEDSYIAPLTLQVTHNGVLIQGLALVTEETRKQLLAFYPGSKFFDEDSLFFHFHDFPPYQYSFSWDGRRVSVMQVKESDHAASEIIKQMNIGYYLHACDLKLPVNNLRELQILKKKMRLG